MEIVGSSTMAQERLKKATTVLDDEPLLRDCELKLVRWASHYYHHPIGEVMMSALPALLRKGEKAVRGREKIYCLTVAGRELDSTDLHRAPRQRSLLEFLKAHPDGLTAASLGALEWAWQGSAAALIKKGLVQVRRQGISRTAGLTADRRVELNAAQAEAVKRIVDDLDSFTCFVLEGVTGSGKTEVYLQVIERVLERGLQAMVLLPEIALTPQLEARFKRRFSVPIARFHSGLGDGERCDAWLGVRQGEIPILLGTRSAVFTPLLRPGLIILDEEHDASFKQQEGFRFSARDLAVVRARQLGIPVILGSATPSLETLINVRRGRYQSLRLPERAGDSAPPTLHLLDIRNRPLRHGVSDQLLEAIRKTLARGEQVLVFLNRRGYAPRLICHACGWVAQCPRCDTNLVLHRGGKQHLCCHHCGHEAPLMRLCESCGSSDLRPLGIGTERAEQVLQQLFPAIGVARIDRDSTRRKGSLEQQLERINSGQNQLILGTQMLAKGHHFPQVTLVAILDGDAGLFSTDFRAPERMAQLIVQVAGRAGRGRKAGRVIIQTRHPEHPLLRTLVERGYAGFAADALAEREAARLPPFSFQALLRASASDGRAPLDFLWSGAVLARQVANPEVEILGPVPAPLARRAGRLRYQLLLQCDSRQLLHRLLDQLMPKLMELAEAKRVRWSLDVDPADLD